MTLRIRGDVAVPGDKSISHRALMLAGAARGTSRLRGLLAGGDTRSTAAVLRGLGLPVSRLPHDGREISLDSPGFDGWRPPAGPLDCGNSGTTARLMMGILASRPFCATLTGDDSLRSRPMRRIVDPLTAMGANIRELEHPDRLPVEICGAPLRSIAHASPHASAQIKSAVLLAGLAAGVPVTVTEPIRSRDHSERMLSALGATVEEAQMPGGWRVSLSPPDGPLPPLDLTVPGDISSAAFLLGLALLADGGELRVRGVGMNPTRTGFLDAAAAMGARIATERRRHEGGEPVADLVVTAGGRLSGIELGAAQVPALIDEIPVLAVLAARAAGETCIRGASELRAKESDRIAVLVANLRAIGAEAEELPDGLCVRGSDRPLAGHVRAHHDHRIAMAFALLAARPENRITIDQPEVAEISYPGYADVLRSLISS